MSKELIGPAVVVITVISVLRISRSKQHFIEKVLDWFPAILFAYIIPAIFTHASGIDLGQIELHNLSKNWILPITITTVMSALSYKQLRLVGLRPIVLFVAGSLAISLLPFLLSQLLGFFDQSAHALIFEQEYWRGLVPIVGGWIGGSTSQLVLKELTNCPEGLFLSVLVLDNILVNIWIIIMFQVIQRSEQLNRIFKITDDLPDLIQHEDDEPLTLSESTIMTLGSIVIAVILTNLVVGSFLWKVIILSIIGLALGNVIRTWNHKLVLKIGGVLIILIMAILGLRLDFASFGLPVVLIILVLIWLILHYVWMMFVAKLLNLHMVWIPIASMANLGGISTAPAVTAAYDKELMPHAILLAILSMVSGTAWGMVTIYLFSL